MEDCLLALSPCQEPRIRRLCEVSRSISRVPSLVVAAEDRGRGVFTVSSEPLGQIPCRPEFASGTRWNLPPESRPIGLCGFVKEREAKLFYLMYTIIEQAEYTQNMAEKHDFLMAAPCAFYRPALNNLFRSELVEI